MRPFPWIAAALLLLSSAAHAQSSITVFTSRAAFEAALPPDFREDFEEARVGVGTGGIFPAPLSSTSSNGFFSPGEIIPGIRIQDDPGPGLFGNDGLAAVGPGFLGLPSKMVGANLLNDGVDVLFDEGGVPAAGLDVFSFPPTTVRVTAFSGNLILGTLDLAASTGAPAFFGIFSADPRDTIDRINVTSSPLVPPASEFIDNVPEPSSGLGALVALGALAAAWRRRRA